MTGWQLVILILGGAVILAWAVVMFFVMRVASGVQRSIREADERIAASSDASRERFEAERDRMNRDFESFRNGIRGDRQWRGRA